MPARPNETASSDEESRESLYSILNLPVSASQDDIRHRYKELSVIFHPDKQQHNDENAMRIAEKRFRQIQRAYEVLTDPGLRQIYDRLGEGGLAARKAVGHRYSSAEEFRAELDRLLAESRRGEPVVSGGELTCAFDAVDVFGPDHALGLSGLPTRMMALRRTLLRVQHTMEVTFKNGVEASLSGRVQAIPHPRAPRDYGNVLGTIRHQFSPRVHFEATAPLLRSHALNLKTKYVDGENQVSLKAHFSQWTSVLFPPLTLELQRRLFVKSLTQGLLIFATGPQASFTASLVSPLHPEGVLAWSTGIQISRYPSLSADLATQPLAGGLKAKLAVDLNITGVTGTIHGVWSNSQNSVVSVTVGASSGGPIFTNIVLDFFGQRIHIPIVLSQEVDVMIGLCALLVPSALAALAHNFMLKPRLRARRISQLQAARNAYRDSIKQRREEAEETTHILSEGAHRRAEHERAIDGLVLLTAKYIASGEDGESPISVDVTIPLQTQVRDSQLMIPGGRSKAGLLGFYDPSPGARKHLKIDYFFHGALHVVEVGDFSQVVLPLRAHLAE